MERCPAMGFQNPLKGMREGSVSNVMQQRSHDDIVENTIDLLPILLVGCPLSQVTEHGMRKIGDPDAMREAGVCGPWKHI
jgi:hypothetical protein